jgi:hypothetical protein
VSFRFQIRHKKNIVWYSCLYICFHAHISIFKLHVREKQSYLILQKIQLVWALCEGWLSFVKKKELNSYTPIPYSIALKAARKWNAASQAVVVVDYKAYRKGWTCEWLFYPLKWLFWSPVTNLNSEFTWTDALSAANWTVHESAGTSTSKVRVSLTSAPFAKRLESGDAYP